MSDRRPGFTPEMLRRYNRHDQQVRRNTSIPKIVDLAYQDKCINVSDSRVLNTTGGHRELPYVLETADYGDPPMISDVDEQIILKLEFYRPVCLAAIQFHCNNPPKYVDAAPPKTVKLFVNRPELDFRDVETLKPRHTIVLDDESLKKKQSLSMNKFRRVVSLQIFFENNLGSRRHTFLNRLSLFGYMYPV
ncbi:PITH domain-containing protein [Babesia sp. Xinjiang]|uniref:PITH domain-containing protein n=1 Tax=Babesia sp. Xinjiang TaxID=462227 RepID=UPI000A2478AD|nr:PITH domain-containing protein [Babesia sp. Xinjiang]ORM41360.1 PITH domain-containing protein [Babesia sp. Xinjiang]